MTDARTTQPLIRSRGINHLALVCRDMARTVAFYEGILGFPLVKTVQLPSGLGQHFFFDIGGDNMLAFFSLPEAPDAMPGISSASARPDTGDLVTAVGSMNHVALNVPFDELEATQRRLRDAGIDCSDVMYHDDSEWTVAPSMHDGVFVASVYFFDPDGVLLELASWTRDLGPADVCHAPSSVGLAEVATR